MSSEQKLVSPFMAALEAFEATEANIIKLERIQKDIEALIPKSVSFGPNPDYEDKTRSYGSLLASLPKIDGWRPEIQFPELDDVARGRLDAFELGEPLAELAVENTIDAPGVELRRYRYAFDRKRRELIRDQLVLLIDQVDADLRRLRVHANTLQENDVIERSHWEAITGHVSQIEVLLGSTVSNPPRWSDLRRHMKFGYVGDLNDIERVDWPAVKAALRKGLFGINDPIPVGVADLSDLVATRPRGQITTKLQWSNIDDETFERLMFSLIVDAERYENPEWLMHTRAQDRGRDLSVVRVTHDEIAGTFRHRVIIQCKHWLSRSVSLTDVSITKDQMALWSEPRVDVLVFATSGRFTADAVQWIERYNAGGQLPRIEMWADSKLESLLASRPALIAEYNLR